MDINSTVQKIYREYQDATKEVEQKRKLWVENPTDKGTWGDYCFALGKEEAFEKAYIMVKKIKAKKSTTRK